LGRVLPDEPERRSHEAVAGQYRTVEFFPHTGLSFGPIPESRHWIGVIDFLT
jgi:hypothetical protein